ncbi:MAG: competence/damage-inducible protein A [Eubacteriales bacterium]|nr:competence/damage-inducible protein A [Eubacteriales bacterium]
MVAEIITVGTEILLGNIVNTNAAYLAEQCARIGLSCYYQETVGDNAERLAQTIRTALGRADIIVLCGGLGPTEDDLTKETAAQVMGRPLHEDAGTIAAMRAYFERRGIPFTPNNAKQALIPEGSVILENPNGTAPGVIIEGEGNTRIVLLPGPPGELRPMFETSVLPYLKRMNPEHLVSRTIKESGIGESIAETMLQDLIDGQTNPTIATYAKVGEVHIRLTAKADSPEEAGRLIDPVEREICERFGDAVYTDREDVTLEGAVVAMLRERGMTLSTAESCTGGMLAQRLTGVPGVSSLYAGGFVTYTCGEKHRMLGVPKELLREKGAISKKTARAMAAGAAKRTHTDVALSVTGNAGPEPSEDKPVGLVYIGCSVNGRTWARKCRFSGNRQKIRECATAEALTFLRECVMHGEAVEKREHHDKKNRDETNHGGKKHGGKKHDEMNHDGKKYGEKNRDERNHGGKMHGGKRKDRSHE